MHHYLFELGFAPKLASTELAAVLAAHKIKHAKTKHGQHHLVISSKNPLDPHHLINILGGSTKIAPQVSTCSSTNLVSAIAGLLQHSPSPTFSLSPINFSFHSPHICGQIKQILAQNNLSSRYLIPTRTTLSPIKLTTQSVVEYILIKNKNTIHIYHTHSVTNYQSWINRDRHRPASDPQSGMLPPKVARMMLNLALTQPPSPDQFILDPFCGSGTILAEALMLNLSAIGSDINPNAIANSQKNLDWLKQQQKFAGNYYLHQADATKLNLSNFPSSNPGINNPGIVSISNHNVTAIITEGDLGPTKPISPTQEIQVLNQLRQLYTQAFANFLPLLIRKGRVVIALPKYKSSQSVKMLQSLIDTCENTGYTRLTGPISYSKPRARVHRAIYVLAKNK